MTALNIWLLFVRPRSVMRDVGSPKKLGYVWPRPPWDGGVADSWKRAPPPRAKFGLSASNDNADIGKSVGKKWAPRARLSRSFKVTETNTDRSATYDFLLVNPR